jgi:hypothetical protein
LRRNADRIELIAAGGLGTRRSRQSRSPQIRTFDDEADLSHRDILHLAARSMNASLVLRGGCEAENHSAGGRRPQLTSDTAAKPDVSSTKVTMRSYNHLTIRQCTTSRLDQLAE